VTDFLPEKPSVARPYCPGCEPNADVLREILDVRWCQTHAPGRDGFDDYLLTEQSTAYGGVEAGGEDNRRWCEVIHRRDPEISSAVMSSVSPATAVPAKSVRDARDRITASPSPRAGATSGR
jgi:hypothetical protein